MQEGRVWEAAMTAAHHKLDNICVILDGNKVQQNGPVAEAEIKNEEPIAAKWRDFGWQVREVDGHNLQGLIGALDEFDTIKGKGGSFMVGQAKWHGKALNKEELAKALAELGKGGCGMMNQMKATRDAFGEALVELGKNRKIVVLSGDLEDSTRAEYF